MAILSFSFLIFVVILLFLYNLIPGKFRWIILLLGSDIIFFTSSKWLILYPIFTTIVIYFVGLSLDKRNKELALLKKSDLEDEVKKEKKNEITKRKKFTIAFGIVVSLLCIIVTKYANFFLENALNFLSIFHLEIDFKLSKLLVPIGISYYTLEAISYIVDIYRGKITASKNIFHVALFLLYFPKVIEGPISRFGDLSKDFFEDNALDFKNIAVGLDFIIYGLFKKMVIADRAGIFVNSSFGQATGGFTTLLVMILYTVQIYAEFSGCIDIVRGVSYLFGIKLPVNFRAPFFSKSIQEFWQRWHISLGAWIKEYVFYPISLSKMNRAVTKFSKEKIKGYLSKFITVAFPLFFVWIVNGIWHGASYKYVVYGMYYYIFMMLALLFKPLFDALLNKLKLNFLILNAFRILRTIIFVIIGMTLFRASSLREFGIVLMSLFQKSTNLFDHGLVGIDFIILIIANVVVLIVSTLEEKGVLSLEKGFTEKPVVRALTYTFIICTIIIFGIYGEGYDASEFIYGAF